VTVLSQSKVWIQRRFERSVLVMYVEQTVCCVLHFIL